jgi:hypothetical protein
MTWFGVRRLARPATARETDLGLVEELTGDAIANRAPERQAAYLGCHRQPW